MHYNSSMNNTNKNDKNNPIEIVLETDIVKPIKIIKNNKPKLSASVIDVRFMKNLAKKQGVKRFVS